MYLFADVCAVSYVQSIFGSYDGEGRFGKQRLKGSRRVRRKGVVETNCPLNQEIYPRRKRTVIYSRCSRSRFARSCVHGRFFFFPTQTRLSVTSSRLVKYQHDTISQYFEQENLQSPCDATTRCIYWRSTALQIPAMISCLIANSEWSALYSAH